MLEPDSKAPPSHPQTLSRLRPLSFLLLGREKKRHNRPNKNTARASKQALDAPTRLNYAAPRQCGSPAARPAAGAHRGAAARGAAVLRRCQGRRPGGGPRRKSAACLFGGAGKEGVAPEIPLLLFCFLLLVCCLLYIHFSRMDRGVVFAVAQVQGKFKDLFKGRSGPKSKKGKQEGKTGHILRVPSLISIRTYLFGRERSENSPLQDMRSWDHGKGDKTTFAAYADYRRVMLPLDCDVKEVRKGKHSNRIIRPRPPW